MNAIITLHISLDSICYKLDLGGQVSWYDAKFTAKDKDLIFIWLLNLSKPVFQAMPLDTIKINCTEEIQKEFKTAINGFAGILNITNGSIKENQHLKGVNKDYTGLLFWNIGENPRYKALYEQLRKSNSDIYYLNHEPGFNKKTREWESSDTPMSINELLDYIRENKIKKIISINHYVPDKYIEKKGIFILPLLEYMGSEWIILDNDPPDLRPQGYLSKSFYNFSDLHFTTMSVLNKWWDKKYKIKTRYITIPHDYNNERKAELTDDYDIIVLTNSRIKNVESVRGIIDGIIPLFPEKTIYKDIYLWYLALRKLILEIMPLGEFERLKHNSHLHSFFFAFVSYLKHKIIADIKTEKQIRIYGDEGWKKLYPEYYKGLLNNEQIDKLYSESNHLFLLLNFSWSYLDASGPVYDVIARGVPFINVPPLVKAKDFEGFTNIEYSDKKQLNYLINNAKKAIYQEDFRNSFLLCKIVLRESCQEIEQSIMGHKSNDLFGQFLKAHQTLIDSMVDEYLDQNENILRECFEQIFIKLNYKDEE